MIRGIAFRRILFGIMLLLLIAPPALAQGRYITISELRLWTRSNRSFVLVDVRDPDSYKQEHIPGAINIPAEEHAKIRNLAPKTAVLYCWSDGTATAVGEDLHAEGYDGFVVLRGGIDAWKQRKLKTEATH